MGSIFLVHMKNHVIVFPSSFFFFFSKTNQRLGCCNCASLKQKIMKGVTKFLCLSVKRNQVDFKSATGRLFEDFRKVARGKQAIPQPTTLSIFCTLVLFFKLMHFFSGLCLIAIKLQLTTLIWSTGRPITR